jgi:phage terminase large subunit-like protein
MTLPIPSPNSISEPSTYPRWIYDSSAIPDPLGHGERAVRFLHALKHPKSTLPLRQFAVDPWVEGIVRRIYGPRDETGARIVKTVVLLVPRGNRKTTLASALALLHTIGPERIPYGEAIFAAADRKQASIAFREATLIVHESPRIAEAVKVYDAHNSAKKIVHPKSKASLEIISGDAGTQHGRTPAFVLADELHIWPNRYLWEALTTGLDKSDDSLLVVATTAGRGHENAAWEIIEDARKVARGEVEDPTILPILFETPRDADWRDEAVWHAANPGLVHGYPSLAGMRRHAARAERSMAEPCWIGVDMAVSIDLAAVVACFRDGDTYTVRPYFFAPEDGLQARADRDRVPYVEWKEQGFLTVTPGNVIDHGAIENCIRQLAASHDVREIDFDPAYAMDVQAPLLADGLPVVTIRQGWITQSPALGVLERIIISRNFRHGGNPILRWNFDNVAIHTDSAGNRTMHKGKSRGRIDGASATWMAVSRAAAHTGGAHWLETVDVDEFFAALKA